MAARRSLGSVWSGARRAIAGAILVVLVVQLGTRPFLRALEQVTIGALVVALVLTGLSTLCAAARWTWVARRLGLCLDLRGAVTAYYRSQLLNQVLPGGVLGDVDRAVRHGERQAASGPPAWSRAARAVAWERAIGQAALLSLVVVATLGLPSPLRGSVAWLIWGGVLSLLAVPAVLAHRLASPFRRILGADLRSLATGSPLVPLMLSVGALVGHVLVLLVALRSAGADLPVARAVPLLLVVLVASSLPVNLAGWGPREGAAAWVFAAAGHGAAQGVTVAAVYGILSLVAALPGALVLTLDALPHRIGAGRS